MDELRHQAPPRRHPRSRRSTGAWLLWALLTGAAAQAAPAAPAIEAEIEALLARLESSRCEFNRNGGWYNGADARTHLHGKLEAIARRTTLRSTEQFIELAATVSSSSGRPYEVKCGAGPSVPSAQWLTRELALLRGAGARAASAAR